MTPEELGQLFPIFLEDPNPGWREQYENEKAQIIHLFYEEEIEQIDHIGSTAIPGIKAKPTVDILLQITHETPDQKVIDNITSLGYEFIPQPDNPPPHMMFVKGYTPQGFLGKMFHVHVRYKAPWNEILFRDYLLHHPSIAKEYETLKTDLAKTFKFDRDGYTEAKTPFVNKVLDLAREYFNSSDNQ